MRLKPKPSKGFVESFVAPAAVTVFVATGSWIAWVSTSSYDANNHISEFQQVSQDLRTVTSQLSDIEQTVGLLKADVEATHDNGNALLQEILEKVSL
jgi:hypothetical protein